MVPDGLCVVQHQEVMFRKLSVQMGDFIGHGLFTVTYRIVHSPHTHIHTHTHTYIQALLPIWPDSSQGERFDQAAR